MSLPEKKLEGSGNNGREIETKAFAELRALLERLSPETYWSLVDRHDFGSAVKALYVVRGQTEPGHRGRVMQTIAEDVGLGVTLLRHAKRFAVVFRRGEAEALDRAELSNGKPFTWSHAPWLVQVITVRERRELIEEVKSNSWTSNELAAAIHNRKGGKANKGGRKPQAPRNLGDRVAQEKKTLDEWLNRDRQVWTRPETSLSGMISVQADGEIAGSVVNAMIELRDSLERVLRRMKKRKAEVEQVLDTLGPQDRGDTPGPNP